MILCYSRAHAYILKVGKIKRINLHKSVDNKKCTWYYIGTLRKGKGI